MLFYNAEKAYVVSAVIAAAVALLYLLDVAQVRVLVAMADGKGAVGKVDEHFAALQVVYSNGVVEGALGRMRQHEHAEAVLCFERFEHFDEGQRRRGLRYRATHAGDVVDNEHPGLGLLHCALDLPLHVIFVIVVHQRVVAAGVKFGADKVFAKVVRAVYLVEVPRLELRCAELEIDIKHFELFVHLAAEGLHAPGLAQAVAHLHGEDGFAEVGIGKQDAQLVLVPQCAEQPARRGLAVFFLEPLVGGLDMEKLLCRISGEHVAGKVCFTLLLGGFLRLAAHVFDELGTVHLISDFGITISEVGLGGETNIKIIL